MSVVISSNFRDVKLSDSSQWAEGSKRFFEDIMDELQKADEEWCASLVIGRKLENAAAYFQQITRGLPWKNVCDPNGLEGAAPIAFGVQTAPWIVLIGKDGKVVRSNIANLDELGDVLKELK